MKLEKDKLKEISRGLIDWISISMEASGGKKAVLGVSGGKDSSVVAALCKEALGKDNVIGVLMPDGIQSDISYAEEICEFLDIKSITVNIQEMTVAFSKALQGIDKNIIGEISSQSRLNIPPRVRMILLYGLSQSIDDARVINTSNLSEDWIGYATVYGDTAGAFSPLGMLTSEEVVQIGEYLGIPDKFIKKEPSDGLTGKSDEDIFGFSYEVLNRYLRQGEIEDQSIRDKIHRMNQYSRFKFLPIPMFDPKLHLAIEDEFNIYK